jgi:hypothetical protein
MATSMVWSRGHVLGQDLHSSESAEEHVRFGSTTALNASSASSPHYPKLRTLAGAAGRSLPCHERPKDDVRECGPLYHELDAGMSRPAIFLSALVAYMSAAETVRASLNVVNSWRVGACGEINQLPVPSTLLKRSLIVTRSPPGPPS